MHTNKNQTIYANITYMYPIIAVIQLFTQHGTKFDLIIDLL
jgi:hypothetical protein